MEDRRVRILLIEDNPGDVRLIELLLQEAGAHNFCLESADCLSTGLERLGEDGFDVLLLDLGLPDSHGLDTLVTVAAHVSKVPVVVLTGNDDAAMGIDAVRRGDQDYLIKGQVDSTSLVRSMRYAMERKQKEERLRVLALVDELTGVHNRRGFLTLAQQQLKLADRTKSPVLLVFIDLNDLKWINDMFGHAEGDQALVEIAEILTEGFRSPDIIARIGGDEFVLLATGVGPNSEGILVNRLRAHVKARNVRSSLRCKLSLSVGTAWYDPEHPCSIEELLHRADRQMYEQKRANQKP